MPLEIKFTITIPDTYTVPKDETHPLVVTAREAAWKAALMLILGPKGHNNISGTTTVEITRVRE